MREAALAEEAQHLELGVVARLEAAERLQDERVVEDDRGVGLLGADRAHVGVPAAARRRRRAQWKLDARVLAVDLGAARAAGRRAARGRLRVGEARRRPSTPPTSSIDRARRSRRRPADARAAAGRARACRPGSAPRRARAPARGGAVAQRRRRRARAIGATSRALEPNQRRLEQPLGERLLVERGQVDGVAIGQLHRRRSASSLSRNQKKPRGASVSRYGSSPMRGKRVRPNISIGRAPLVG